MKDIFTFSCPFDSVTVYDGFDNTSAVIGTYCGQHRNLVIYSSTENLFVSFEAIQRTANTQNRGFKGIFEFSEGFVKLGMVLNRKKMNMNITITVIARDIKFSSFKF